MSISALIGTQLLGRLESSDLMNNEIGFVL